MSVVSVPMSKRDFILKKIGILSGIHEIHKHSGGDILMEALSAIISDRTSHRGNAGRDVVGRIRLMPAGLVVKLDTYVDLELLFTIEKMIGELRSEFPDQITTILKAQEASRGGSHGSLELISKALDLAGHTSRKSLLDLLSEIARLKL